VLHRLSRRRYVADVCREERGHPKIRAHVVLSAIRPVASARPTSHSSRFFLAEARVAASLHLRTASRCTTSARPMARLLSRWSHIHGRICARFCSRRRSSATHAVAVLASRWSRARRRTPSRNTDAEAATKATACTCPSPRRVAVEHPRWLHGSIKLLEFRHLEGRRQVSETLAAHAQGRVSRTVAVARCRTARRSPQSPLLARRRLYELATTTRCFRGDRDAQMIDQIPCIGRVRVCRACAGGSVERSVSTIIMTGALHRIRIVVSRRRRAARRHSRLLRAHGCRCRRADPRRTCASVRAIDPAWLDLSDNASDARL